MIGERIREARQAAHLTLRDLSSEVQISAATLSRIETNQQPLDLTLFLQLAKVLKIRPQDLLDAEEADSAVEPVVRRVSSLRTTDRITFWRELAAHRRKEAAAQKTRARVLTTEVEELLAQVDVVRAEIEVVHRRLGGNGRKRE